MTSNWISIDQEKCNGCKFCVVRCPRVFSKVDDTIVGQANILNCNLCGHCISLCDPQAITHKLLDMQNFPPVKPEANFETGQFIDFIRNRRSHRHFKNKLIAREELEILVDACRYAPTGSNIQSVELVVLQDKELIKQLSEKTVTIFEKFGAAADQRIKELETNKESVPEQLSRTRIYGERLKEAENAGLDPIFHKSPAVLIFHSPKDSSAPKDNCVIASTTVSLLARTMGIESTYIGLFEIVARGNEEILSALNIPLNHEIYSVLIMGYPRMKYHYQVDRSPIQTSWQ